MPSAKRRTRGKRHNISEMKITSFMFPHRMQFQVTRSSLENQMRPPKKFFVSNKTCLERIYEKPSRDSKQMIGNSDVDEAIMKKKKKCF